MKEGSSRDEPRDLDTRARHEAQRVFDRPFVLEAGAGTGKTAVLVSRVMAWSLAAGWERAVVDLAAVPTDSGHEHRVAARVLSGVVAITFTEAAAAEMARRVERALAQVETGELPVGVFADCLPEAPVRAARARWLRGALDYLEVHTIHAWCRRLLAAQPLEAGLHPHLEVDADGRRQAEVVREVLETRLREKYGQAESDFLALAAREVGPREIEAELLALLAEGLESHVLAADPLGIESVARLGERVEQLLQRTLAAAGPELAARGPGKAVDVLARTQETLARVRAEPIRDRAGLELHLAWLRGAWDESELLRVKTWGRGGFGVAEARLLGDRAQAFTGAAGELGALLDHLRALDPELLDCARRALAELLGEVEGQLRARGVVSFSALLTEAARLLSEHPSAAERVRSRVDQLLIDEFQDTDRRQCDIVRAVALGGPKDERPGLFLVGDPKQSIYGWRSADLAAYDAFLSDVKSAGGVRHQLCVNYRSVPAVLDEVERIIAPSMHESPGVQPPFQRLLPSTQNQETQGFSGGWMAPIEIWVPVAFDGDGAPRKTSVAEAARIEATALARDLRSLHDEHGVAWSRVGVLFRSRGEWDLYLGALREVGVPFAVEGDRSYYQRRAIIDVSALVRSVLNPNDHLALLGLMRSVAVGVPDAALVPLWRLEFPALMTNLEALTPERRADLEAAVRQVARDLPDVAGAERVRGWEQNLLWAIEVLADSRRSFREDPPDVFVERLRTTLLFEVSEAARFLGAWRIANLDRFFRDLTTGLCEGGDGHSVWRQLANAVLDEEEAEEATPREIVDDAVQVLTIHGAKGLDFEHVYLMQAHKGSAVRGAGRIAPAVLEGVNEYALFGAATPGFDRARAASARVSEAELVRTLYVAATRARSRLVISGLWPGGDRGIPASHADLLRRRSDPPADVATLVGRLPAVGSTHVDAEYARWSFPARSSGAAPAPGTAESQDLGLASPERVAADARALQAACVNAALRAKRRFGGSASNDAPAAWREERAEGWQGGSVRGDSEAARAVGTAVHRVLEEIDLAADPDDELARQHEALERELRAALSPEQSEAAIDDARALLADLAAGPLLEKLRELARGMVVRELPLLISPGDEEGAPAGFVSGVVDLLYRDPVDGKLVIADYKTDRVSPDVDLGEHGRAYAHQGQAYQRGVREAFSLAYLPRFELWYLRRGEIAGTW